MDVDRCSLYLLGLLDGCGQMQSISPGSPAPDGCGQMQSISPGPLGWIWTDAVYIYSTDYNSTEERRMRMIKYRTWQHQRELEGPALWVNTHL